MRVLLDTCALLWYVADNARLTPVVWDVMRSLETEVVVSAASVWEIAIKARQKKLPGTEHVTDDIVAVVRQMGFEELPVSLDHAQRAGLLPGSHKDPFDRILIAQAQAESLPIVSSDTIFDDYRIRRIW